MNAPITWHGLGLIALALLGVALFVGGLMEMFAGGMSDARGKGQVAAARGCATMLAGLAILIVLIVRAVG